MSLQTFAHRDPKPFDPDEDPPVIELTPEQQAAKAAKKAQRDAHMAKLRADRDGHKTSDAPPPKPAEPAPPVEPLPPPVEADPSQPVAVEPPVSDSVATAEPLPPPPEPKPEAKPTNAPDAIPQLFNKQVFDAPLPNLEITPPGPMADAPAARASTIDQKTGQASLTYRTGPEIPRPPPPGTPGAPGTPPGPEAPKARRKIAEIMEQEEKEKHESVARGWVKIFNAAEIEIIEGFYSGLITEEELKEFVKSRQLDPDKINAVAEPLSRLMKTNPNLVDPLKQTISAFFLIFGPRTWRHIKYYQVLKEEKQKEDEAAALKAKNSPFGRP